MNQQTDQVSSAGKGQRPPRSHANANTMRERQAMGAQTRILPALPRNTLSTEIALSDILQLTKSSQNRALLSCLRMKKRD